MSYSPQQLARFDVAAAKLEALRALKHARDRLAAAERDYALACLRDEQTQRTQGDAA